MLLNNFLQLKFTSVKTLDMKISSNNMDDIFMEEDFRLNLNLNLNFKQMRTKFRLFILFLVNSV